MPSLSNNRNQQTGQMVWKTKTMLFLQFFYPWSYLHVQQPTYSYIKLNIWALSECFHRVKQKSASTIYDVDSTLYGLLMYIHLDNARIRNDNTLWRQTLFSLDQKTENINLVHSKVKSLIDEIGIDCAFQASFQQVLVAMLNHFSLCGEDLSRILLTKDSGGECHWTWNWISNNSGCMLYKMYFNICNQIVKIREK